MADGGGFNMRLIRMAAHEDRLTMVDHLEELRRRLIVSLAALAVAFGLCLWQSHALLRVINAPLSHQTQAQVKRGEGPLGQTALAQQAVLKVAADTEALAQVLGGPRSGLAPQARSAIMAAIPRLRADVARVPRKPQGNKPATFGVGEPFTATITVALYFALLIALPLILLELYGFFLPALTGEERRKVTPLLWSVPALFACGVLFGYFVVLPAAIHFLQNFNSGEFNVLVQASQYYRFAATMLITIGLSFELPVAVVGAVHLGAVSAHALRRGRRYAFLGCVVVAALLPGEVVVMALEVVPLYALYELSIVASSVIERRRVVPPVEAAGASGA
ncbi:MAG: twin-arginine translocase subunit TatC [Solirubrobacteraceae bacterium]